MTTPASLLERWQELLTANPRLRARDAAAELGVSEGALLDVRCLARGDGGCLLADAMGAVRRLRMDDPCEMLDGLQTLGPLTAITRNNHCVHEKTGEYGPCRRVHGPVAVVNTPAVDLRIFLRYWLAGFAVDDVGRDGAVRRSLQFFDGDGRAVHKVYATGDTKPDQWEAFVTANLAADLGSAAANAADSGLTSGTVAGGYAPVSGEAETGTVDREAFRTAWAALRDTHEFNGLLRRFGLSRLQALRLADPEMAWLVKPQACRDALMWAASGHPIMAFVGNRGCLQIHSGPVEKVVDARGWLNVLDPDFNLHLKEDGISETWLVRKPTEDGIVTAVEAFGSDGSQIVQFFGVRKPGATESDSWCQFTAELPRLAGTGD